MRCKTRYCNSTCQHDHWRRGHKQICKKIHRGGNAEQYHADNKYKGAVAVAVEACADDTKGQTCYICTEAVHWKTKEGLVRGCACRGTAGVAHVSCLVEQAKILMAEGEENHLEMQPRWDRWHTCSLCEQNYHGVVYCALGWACWKTYVGRPEEDQVRMMATGQLGNGLLVGHQYEAALLVKEAELSMARRLGASERRLLDIQSNLSTAYGQLGRLEQSLRIQRDVYSGWLKLHGEDNYETLREANNLAATLKKLNRYDEAKSLLLKTMPVARRILGESNELTLTIRWTSAVALRDADRASRDDMVEAVAILKEVLGTSLRMLGTDHPLSVRIRSALRLAQRNEVFAVWFEWILAGFVILLAWGVTVVVRWCRGFLAS